MGIEQLVAIHAILLICEGEGAIEYLVSMRHSR